MKFRVVLATFAAAVALAATTAAQHAAPQEKGTKPGGQAAHKMNMPPMDDATFLQMMTMHHQHGMEMSKAEESKGTRDDVKALAAKIREGQERDIKEMQGMKVEAPAHGSHDADMQKHQKMTEEMSQSSLEKIEGASGAAVDEAFLREMAMHHQMGLQMIDKGTFKDAKVKAMAARMAKEQKSELQELKKLQRAK